MSAVRGRLHTAWTWLRTPVGAVALVALAHGLVWSVLTPPFQVPDEPGHFAYVQYLAETGKLPPSGKGSYSSEQVAGMDAMNVLGVIGRPLIHPPGTAAAAAAAQRGLDAAADLSRSDGGGATGASGQPPLYYALASVPYRLGSLGDLGTELLAVRLFGVLCFVLTAITAALLVAEVLPGRPWAPLVGGLVVALQPAVAFIATGANPDTLLFLLGTSLLLVSTRIIRRGLTLRRGVALGLVAAAGALTKITFAGLIPGAIVVLAVGGYRLYRAGEGRRDLARMVGATVVAGLALPLLYVVYVSATGRGILPLGPSTPSLPAAQIPSASTTGLISYTWQLYLPRLPFLTNQFGLGQPWIAWVDRFTGQLGWLDYSPASWAVEVVREVFLVSLGLVGVAAVRARSVVWRRRWELVVYAAFAVGLALLIAKSGYDYRRTTGSVFEQARYLFPLVGLYAIAVCVACTAFGRRVAPVLGASFIGLACLHVLADVFATVARFYG